MNQHHARVRGGRGSNLEPSRAHLSAWRLCATRTKAKALLTPAPRSGSCRRGAVGSGGRFTCLAVDLERRSVIRTAELAPHKQKGRTTGGPIPRMRRE
jgi:hypothetical protein